MSQLQRLARAWSRADILRTREALAVDKTVEDARERVRAEATLLTAAVELLDRPEIERLLELLQQVATEALFAAAAANAAGAPVDYDRAQEKAIDHERLGDDVAVLPSPVVEEITGTPLYYVVVGR